MALYVIHSVTAVVHSVNTYQDACQDTNLTMLHAAVRQLRLVQRNYAGMANHAIH
jgi:hypothetical protein